ncbi:MAG: hydrolase, partial [Spirochaetes bacterium]|nr:hydrolase [Spirochaetota bacterium]
MGVNKFLLKAKSIITPDESIEDASVLIENKKIKEINPDKKEGTVFDFGNRIILPGMINAHDHLLGNYYPRVGNGPYLNWLPWDNDLKSSPVYAERSNIPPKIIYQLGAMRNLIAGTTTVSDHIPHFVNDPYVKMLPIRVLKNYTLAHECSEYDLKWGDGIDIEYKKAVKNNYSF